MPVEHYGGMRLKKLLSAVLSVALLVLGMPAAPLSAASADMIIDMHGTKTWMGTSDNWGKAWNEDNFTDVTNEDATCTGSLTIKSGTVKNVDVNGTGSNLTVSGGSVGDVTCGGSVTVSKGTVKSISSNGSITLSGGTVKRDIESDNGDVTFDNSYSISGSVSAEDEVTFGSGKVNVSGAVTAKDVTFDSGSTVKVTGPVTFTDKMELNDCTVSAQRFDGNDSGKIETNGFKYMLPTLGNIDTLQLHESDKVFANQKIDVKNLILNDKAELISNSAIDTDTLQGPGILCIYPDKLTIHGSVSGTPRLVFSQSVGSGTVAFHADSGAVGGNDILLFGYIFDISSSGGQDVFKLKYPDSDGLTLSSRDLAVDSGKPGKLTAAIKPQLSEYAEGTKIVWELHGDSSAFSISPSDQTCSVSANDTSGSSHRAVLTAYLADKSGNCLTDYRADSCVLTTGYPGQATDVMLDTSSVSVLINNTYGVLAVTSSTTMPSASSYNSAVAIVGSGKPYKSSSGSPGWLYTVTGVGPGSTVIDIAGQQMAVTVNSGIIMDTSSYTFAPGGKYIVGVQARGVTQNDLFVYSSGSAVTVQFLKQATNGTLLYQICGAYAGTADVTFTVMNGQSVKMGVTVQAGAKGGGRSARLVALKQ